MTMEENTEQKPFESSQEVNELKQNLDQVREKIQQIVVGQTKSLDLILITLLANGHALIEGVPGIAKTLLAKLTARAVSVDFNRAQFTPDLMPSDLLGTSVFNVKKSEFEFKSGPVFTNILLIDEINRAPAKTQAALFEVMEERQASIDGVTHPMADPYLVLATQNPIDHEGTYKLPEAQLDRFLLKIEMDYPAEAEEVSVLQRHLSWNENPAGQLQPVLSGENLRRYKQVVQKIKVDDDILRYIAQIVGDTRDNPALFLGGSPRASLALLKGSQAYAALQGRDFVTPDDVKFLAVPVLNHRVALTPEREMEGYTVDEVIQSIIKKVEVPR